MNSSSNNNPSGSNDTANNNSTASIMSRRGRASPFSLSAASSQAVNRSSVNHNSTSNTSNNNNSNGDILRMPHHPSPMQIQNMSSGSSSSGSNKRPRTQKLYLEDAASHNMMMQYRHPSQSGSTQQVGQQQHPSDIALTAANAAAGVLYNHHQSQQQNIHRNNSMGHLGASSSYLMEPSGNGSTPNSNNSNNNSTASNSSNNAMKKAMIGTTMPIHFAKPVFRNKNNHHRSSNANSNLGRSMSNSNGIMHQGNALCLDSDDDDSPQKILLSLSKTPPTSFDDRETRRRAYSLPYLLNAASAVEASAGSNAAGGTAANTSSNTNDTNTHGQPSSPPQLLNAHRTFTSPGTIFFDPSPTGGVGGMHIGLHSMNTPNTQTGALLDMAPSFSLFNPPSFDSLGGYGDSTSLLVMQKSSTSLDHDTAQYPNSQQPSHSMGGLDQSMSNHLSTQREGQKQHLQATNSITNTMLMMSPCAAPSSSVISGAGVTSNNTGSIKREVPRGVCDDAARSSLLANIQPRTRAKPNRMEQLARRSQIKDESKTKNLLSSPQSLNNSKTPKASDLPVFYSTLLKYRQCFKDFNFLLPGLKSYLNVPYGQLDKDIDCISAVDLNISLRRVRASVCAFGGGCLRDSDRLSIPNDVSSQSGNKDEVSSKYDEMLMKRFQESDAPEGRLSWDLEEHPPIEGDLDNSIARTYSFKKDKKSSIAKEDSTKSIDDGMLKTPDKIFDNAKNSKTNSIGVGGKGSQKMKYRCKLCGQPKQNHICPYAQTLQRSIGTQIYPAVNAFTAHEPGALTQSIVEMNSFANGVPNPTPTRSSHVVRPSPIRMVDQAPPSTPYNPTKVQSTTNKVTPETPSSDGGKLSSNSIRPRDILFVDAADLRAEAYRVVTPINTTRPKSNDRKGPGQDEKLQSSDTAFRYPKIPMAYSQRKRLSDYLFSLTKEREGLTDETAVILRNGRDNDSDFWDVCIAELLTQVLVILYCSPKKSMKYNGSCKSGTENTNESNNNQLEGLKNFLLQIGIAC